ncbi:MAG: fatty acid desaturase, partial [Humibacillus sp.]|nr:fatty acid desaturase [Humibacillus sp.]
MTATTTRPAEAAPPVLGQEGSSPTPQPRKPVLAATGSPAKRPHAAAHLSDEQVAELGRELDAVRDRVIASRGAADAAYIRRVIKTQRTLEIAGRATLLLAKHRPALVAGTAMLSVAKILENMEIGHNVLHGQWDWMRDPDIHSTTWEWDFVTPAAAWKHTHNDLHHTWTNVLGKDKDVGYTTLRMDEDQPWHWANLGNPVYNMILAPLFEWGIAIYDLELEAVKDGEKSKDALKKDLRAMGRKVVRQFTKDYAATPLAAAVLGSGRQALVGTLVANAVRNVWAHSVIFCGHFPSGVETFTEEEIEGETRGDWYIRQMLGSANISGTPLMHLMTGNLSHQIEHHCFPDLPSNRYAQVA